MQEFREKESDTIEANAMEDEKNTRSRFIPRVPKSSTEAEPCRRRRHCRCVTEEKSIRSKRNIPCNWISDITREFYIYFTIAWNSVPPFRDIRRDTYAKW